MRLNEIGKKHKTDKVRHGYLDKYEDYIQRQGVGRFKNILEIGVRSGASLRMWAEYFPEAKVVGIDVNPDCKRHENKETGIEVIIGDQTDKCVIDQCAGNLCFDLIVDDGSHVNEWTLATFNLAFPQLRKGGVYIVEDLHCSYMNLEKTKAAEKWSGMEHAPKIPRQDRLDIDYLISKVAHYVDFRQASELHVHKNFIVVVK